jgi:replicative DNA helicase
MDSTLRITVERAILARSMISSADADEIMSRINPDHIHDCKCREVYKIACMLYGQGKQIDMLSVSQQAAYSEVKNLQPFIAELLDIHGAKSDGIKTEDLIDAVIVAWQADQLRELAEPIATVGEKASVETILASIQTKMDTINHTSQREGYHAVYTLYQALFLDLNNLMLESDAGKRNYQTGFPSFDKLTTGLEPQKLWFVAGRPSMGKSAFALNVAINAAKNGAGVAIFSLEMSRKALLMRMLSSESKVPLQHIRTAQLTYDELDKISVAMKRLSELSIALNDCSSGTLHVLRSETRKLKAKQRIDLLIIDYLQLIKIAKSMRARHEEIAFFTAGLKELAKELEVTVLCLAQTNRAIETRSDKTPILSDLRESGSIENDADLVAFVHRPEIFEPNNQSHKGKASLMVLKQRDGPIGTVPMHFQGEIVTFTEATTHYE